MPYAYYYKDTRADNPKPYFVVGHGYEVETRWVPESSANFLTFQTSDIEVFLELLTDKGEYQIIQEVIREYL